MMIAHTPYLTKRALQRNQRGVTLLISLIMLIAMTLAGLALFRQVGAGIIVARNLTFREATLAAADRGVEEARTWVRTSGADFGIGNADLGYYPAWCNVSLDGGSPDADDNGETDDCANSPPPSTFIPSQYNWENSVTTNTPDGTQIDYVIHRMCSKPGAINVGGQQCVTKQDNTSSVPPSDNPGYQAPLSGTMRPYFRITARATGPLNTVVYTQTIIY